MNFKEIYRAVALQKKLNFQIDTYGYPNQNTIDEKDAIIKFFTREEIDEFLMVFDSTKHEEEFYAQEEIAILTSK
jgi:hypothetical protein